MIARHRDLAQLKQSHKSFTRRHCFSLRLRKMANRAESAMATRCVVWTENMEVGRAAATAYAPL